jgi:hypothetical protein
MPSWEEGLVPGLVAAGVIPLLVAVVALAADPLEYATMPDVVRLVAAVAVCGFVLTLWGGGAGAVGASGALAAVWLAMLYRVCPSIGPNGVDVLAPEGDGQQLCFCNWCSLPSATGGLVLALCFATLSALDAAAPLKPARAGRWLPPEAVRVAYVAVVAVQAGLALWLVRQVGSPSCYSGEVFLAGHECASPDSLPVAWGACASEPGRAGWVGSTRASLLHTRARLVDVVFFYCLPAVCVGATLTVARPAHRGPCTLLVVLSTYAAVHAAEVAGVLLHMAVDYHSVLGDCGSCLGDKLQDAVGVAVAVAATGAAAAALAAAAAQ